MDPKQTALLTHYLQLATTINLPWLQEYLQEILAGTPNPEQSRKKASEQSRQTVPDETRLQVKDCWYTGRKFQTPGGPCVFMGIDDEVIDALLYLDMETVLNLDSKDNFSGLVVSHGGLATRLSDGLLRIDYC